MGKYRAGAIGRTGQGNYGHGLHLSYRDIDGVEFAAVADPDDVGRAKAARETGATRTYADYREMLAKESLDLVSVCPRWVDCHEEMVLACIDAGCHIYAEKPLAADLASADRMIEAADRAGRKIAVAHQGVYLPQVHAVRDMLRAGRIGRLLAMEAVGKQDARGGGEDMMVLGTHLFNMMRFFAGDPAWMVAHVTVGGREMTPADAREAREPIGPIAGDAVVSLFAFDGGIDGRFSSRANQPGKGRGYGLALVGETGRIAISGNASDIAIWEGDAWAPWAGGCDWMPLDVPMLPLHEAGNRLAALDLIDAIEVDREPLSSARDARWALEMILGAYASQICGGRVDLPLVSRGHPLAQG